MTTFNTLETICPVCGHKWGATICMSICTWLNPSIVQQIYEKGTLIECPECDAAIHVQYNLLVNCRSGMFYLNTGQDIFNIRYQLYLWGVVDLEGNIIERNKNQDC